MQLLYQKQQKVASPTWCQEMLSFATQKPFSPSDRGMFYSTTLGCQEMEEYYEEETYEEIVGGGGGGGR